MKEKYKYIFMKYIYKKLGLKEVENNLMISGIKDSGLDTKEISKYFKIVNEVNEDMLVGSLKEKYDYYLSFSIEQLSSPDLEEQLTNFIEETYKLLLFPKVNDSYVYYGPINHKYMVPRDSIVLGFYYNEFELDDKDFDEKHFQNDALICDNLNRIQYVLGPKAEMNVSVIRYNEFTINNIMVR